MIFHGGPATSYAVRWNAYARYFVSLGYAVIEPNIRGSSGFGRAYEEADNREKRANVIKDAETVNRWAKSQPWCDGERVAIWGQSYGGYSTYGLGRKELQSGRPSLPKDGQPLADRVWVAIQCVCHLGSRPALRQ